MAKRKKRKDSTSSKNKVSIEFIGLILILIGVIGIGVFGPVGSLIKHFAIFLVGTYSNILILFTMFLGLYFIVKRSKPKFYSARFIGIYLLTFSTQIDTSSLSPIKLTFSFILATFGTSVLATHGNP